MIEVDLSQNTSRPKSCALLECRIFRYESHLSTIFSLIATPEEKYMNVDN